MSIDIYISIDIYSTFIDIHGVSVDRHIICSVCRSAVVPYSRMQLSFVDRH